MKPLITFWKFSRPHTIIGSVISICTLYTIVCSENKSQHFSLLTVALIIGITTNIFIVGINQIADVEIDKINKPFLPVANGDLSIRNAKIIVFASLIISLVLASVISIYLVGIIFLSSLIGWAYSMPPFHLKKHHVLAALAITSVRGIFINVGGFLVFNFIVNHSIKLPINVQILTLFILAFSIVIAWFKDIPDVKGDAQYNIKTLAVLYSQKTALVAGNVLVGAAYLFTIIIKSNLFFTVNNPGFETRTLLLGNIFLFALFILNSFSIKLNEQNSLKRFYRRFWGFFFAEYLLYLAVYSVKFYDQS